MQCMEVWGGNQPADSGVIMAGLDAWVYSQPFGGAEGGGDVHYVSSCATGRIARMLVADVSGHGADVAQVAVSLRKMMRRFINFLDQRRFVSVLNHEFQALAARGQFATALVLTFFAPTNDLSVSNAGHPPPLWYRARTGKWSVLDQRVQPEGNVGDLPLGVLDTDEYGQFNVRLDVGDMVVCYTDSLIESRGSDGQLLGVNGLLRVVEELDEVDANDFVKSLLGRIETLNDRNLLGDDVTVLVMRPNGLAPSVPFKERILAPWRIVRTSVRAVFSRDEPIPWPEISMPSLGGFFIQRLNRVRRGGRSTR